MVRLHIRYWLGFKGQSLEYDSARCRGILEIGEAVGAFRERTNEVCSLGACLQALQNALIAVEGPLG
jgi:hypothetical protein